MSEIIQKLNPLQNTVEQVHVILRKEIIDMRLHPGEAISEKELCGRFEISRTPVREACLRLSFENLVEIFPQLEHLYQKFDGKMFAKIILSEKHLRQPRYNLPHNT